MRATLPCKHADTLVLSGGGLKGVAMMGAVDRMRSAGMLSKVRTVVGTSAGALIGALVATKRDMRAALGVMQGHRYCPDFDFDRFHKHFGLDSGDSITSLLGALVPETAHELTFEDVRREYGTALVVCVTNVSRRCAEYLGPDTHPDMPIALAIRMSCSVPLYFAAVRHNAEWYVDGSISDNFPCDWAADQGARRIVGISCRPTTTAITSFEGFVTAVVESVVASPSCSRAEVLDLHLPGVVSLNFGASPAELARLFGAGATQANTFLKKRA